MESIPVNLIPRDIEEEINNLLLPEFYQKNVLDLADLIGMELESINYIREKEKPFHYLLRYWFEEDEKQATFKNLKTNVEKLQRPDVLELVDKAIQVISEANMDEIQELAYESERRLERTDSCQEIAEYRERYANVNNETSGNDNDKNDELEYEPTTVYVSYLDENEDHKKNIVDFVNDIRKIGIDATCNIFEPSTQSPYSIITNLRKADYVLVICSESMKEVEKIQTQSKELLVPDDIKNMVFTLTQIIQNIYKNGGKNTKYIPILLPNCKSKRIPKFLQGMKRYRYPKDFDDLIYRICNQEKCILSQDKHRLKDLFKQKIL